MLLDDQELRTRLAEIAQRTYDGDNFLRDLLRAYGFSASDLAAVQNQSAEENEILYQNVVFFKIIPQATSFARLNSLASALKYHLLTELYAPKYLIATDLQKMVAIKTRTGQKLVVKLSALEQHREFFDDWWHHQSSDAVLRTEDKSSITKVESSVTLDRRAADYAKVLYDELSHEGGKQLTYQETNRFFCFLLFCFFAEHLGIFAPQSFSRLLEQETRADGSDLTDFFAQLILFLTTGNFEPTDSPLITSRRCEQRRFRSLEPAADFATSSFGSFLCTLFGETALEIPAFNTETRSLLLRSSKFDWSLINPDIFGTIFQSITAKRQRNVHGMDYTSVKNVLKVIEPLFLNQLWQEFWQKFSDVTALQELWRKLSLIRILDPACGSGNFLIVSYKKLRELELEIILRLRQLSPANFAKQNYRSRIHLHSFCGIELEDLPCTLAQLSLVLAQYQIEKTARRHDVLFDASALSQTPQIIRGNAARLDWAPICPGLDPASNLCIYLVSNPPYKGATKQTSQQKADFAAYFGDEVYSKNMNYAALWLIKSARYLYSQVQLGNSAELAFITADSICQGEQVGLIFPKVFATGAEISFAHRPFHWSNDAKAQAGVDVIILGLRIASDCDRWPKYLFFDSSAVEVEAINPYLVAARPDLFITRRTRPPALLPPLLVGSMPLDDGNLTLNRSEYEELSAQSIPSRWLRPLLGAEEILKLPCDLCSGKKLNHSVMRNIRHCLWIEDVDYLAAKNYSTLAARFAKVADCRARSRRPTTQKAARFPYRFAENRHQSAQAALAIPSLSSKNRPYYPMAYLEASDLIIVSNTALVIYDPPLWLFALLQSQQHQVWLKAVSGSLGNSYRYTATLAYNTFPLPPLSTDDQEKLSSSAENILQMRGQYRDKSLAEIYDQMPAELQDCYVENDQLVDQIYGQNFSDDAARLAYLFRLYAQNI